MITIRFRRMPSPKGKLAQLPKHATSGAAGADLHANIDEEVTIPPMGRALVPTGLAIELPDASYGAFVFARSGLAVKHGLTLSNSVGVIDSDYRGEISVGLVNLSDKKEVYVDTLSRGMKQRLCVARALIHNPSLLVLDEPNSGLDPRARVEMKELLQNLRSMGKTIVISSHILSELAEMCNSIGIMDHGKLVEAGNIEDVMEHVFGGNRIVISVHGEMEPAVRMLKEHPQIRVESVGEKEIHISHAMKEEEIAQLIAQMIQNGIIVTGFYKEEGNLESLFMQLTGGQEDEN